MISIDNHILQVVQNKDLLEIYSCLQPEMFDDKFWFKLQKTLQDQTFTINNVGEINQIKCKVNSTKFELVLKNKHIMFDLQDIKYGYLYLSNSKINPNLGEYEENIYISNINCKCMVRFSIKCNTVPNQLRPFWLSSQDIEIAQKLLKNPELLYFI